MLLCHRGASFSNGLFNELESPLPILPNLSQGSAGKRKKLHKEHAKKVAKRAKCISAIAREAIMFDCSCKEPCLASVGSTITDSIDMMTEYMTPWMNMEKNEHRQKFFAILEGCAHGVTAGGHLEKR